MHEVPQNLTVALRRRLAASCPFAKIVGVPNHLGDRGTGQWLEFKQGKNYVAHHVGFSGFA